MPHRVQRGRTAGWSKSDAELLCLANRPEPELAAWNVRVRARFGRHRTWRGEEPM